MPSLSDVLKSLVETSQGFEIEAPEGWTQGRTLYGGITAALAFQAARLAKPDLAPLRSAQIAYVGPASGKLLFQVEVLRQGRSATIVNVDCRTEAGLAARAVFTCGAARDSAVAHDLAPAPDTAPPEACEPFWPSGPRPGFARNFELRLAAGARPLSGDEKPEFIVWVRLGDAEGVDPVVACLALADSPPPAAMVSFPSPAMISTMTWSIDFQHPVTANGWRLLRSASEQAGDGYSLQTMDLWDVDGRRIAAARQVVAVFI